MNLRRWLTPGIGIKRWLLVVFAGLLLLAVAGVSLVVIGVYRAARALTDPFRTAEGGPLVELIYQKRFLARGPRIVAIGGGTGLSTLLRGLKEHTSNLTAIVNLVLPSPTYAGRANARNSWR